MADVELSDVEIEETIVPSRVKRPRCRIEFENGEINVGDTVRVVLQIRRDGSETWNTAEVRSHTPTIQAAEGRKISLVAEMAIVEVPE